MNEFKYTKQNKTNIIKGEIPKRMYTSMVNQSQGVDVYIFILWSNQSRDRYYQGIYV